MALGLALRKKGGQDQIVHRDWTSESQQISAACTRAHTCNHTHPNIHMQPFTHRYTLTLTLTYTHAHTQLHTHTHINTCTFTHTQAQIHTPQTCLLTVHTHTNVHARAQAVRGDINVAVEWQITREGLLLKEVELLERLLAEKVCGCGCLCVFV